MSLSPLNQLLHLLADGQFHSGTELGHHLAISRAAVWKQLCGIEAMGVTLHRVRGKGYRIPNGLDLLDVEAIYRHQPELRPNIDIQLQMSATSTNALLMERVGVAPIQGQVLMAEVQTEGRGRMGRQWYSPFASQLALSLGWQFSSVQALEGLSLLVGLATVETLHTFGVEGLGLKWPNDVLLHGKKLAGILLELHGDATGQCQVVIGVGINVYHTHSLTLDQPWTSLQDNNIHVMRNELAADFLRHLQILLKQFEVVGFAMFQDRWQKFHTYQDQWVKVVQGAVESIGVCHGVNTNGALLLEVDGKVCVHHGGDISLRPLVDACYPER